VALYSGTELVRIDVIELYFAELFRRSRYLAQLCQASVHEGVREDVYSGRHRDGFCLTSGDGGLGETLTRRLAGMKSPNRELRVAN
jgi:hypothetical protein